MTDYRDIKYTLPKVTFSGVAESSPVEGNIWYDSGKFYLGTSQSFSNVWSSGGNRLAGVYYTSGAGTQTAGLSTGGYDASSITDATEEYNGTAWSVG